MIRQGDILFVPCETIPEKATRVSNRIIASGDSTNHSHLLRRGSGQLLKDPNGVLYIRAIKESCVDHEEHDTVTLNKGCWRVVRQRTYEPAGWRNVSD